MLFNKKYTIGFWIVLFLPLFFFGQKNSTIQFIENKGQLPSQVEFSLKLNSGDIYLEGNTTTFCLYDKSLISKRKHNLTSDSIMKGHTYKVHFEGANDKLYVDKFEQSAQYYNYFIGNEPAKWATQVHAFEEIQFRNVYEGIDVKYYGFYGQVKYDFIVDPSGTPSDIHLSYEGISIDNLNLKKGHLLIETNVGNVIEQSPYAYQIIDGQEIKVPCYYVLRDGVLGFEFPEGYDESLDLVIDPVLTFSTFTGSTADNWGYTATNDANGNMYVGGIAFGVNYPTTTGAFQINFGGGVGINYPGTDASISKFSSDGTQLLYSTYFGGSGNENPHSIVCNANGELYVFGSTGSNDLPINSTFPPYDGTFAGGTPFDIGVSDYPIGMDAFVMKFNANGTSILGSTYIGGTGNDAVNQSTTLNKNYGDDFRGEIIVDANDHCYVATTTLSTNFPVVGAAQGANNGGQEGVLFKLNSNLGALLFSTYFGGAGDDACYSIQLNSLGEMVFTGGTTSANLNTTPGVGLSSYQGLGDGFIGKLSPSGNTLLASGYVGTTAYDQSYFVQTDLDDNVYLFGQTQGPYPVFPFGNVYNNANGKQFLHEFNPSLTNTVFSTVFGSGIGSSPDISPSAFLVSDCGLIYISGWGGQVNAASGGGNTNGLPTTLDAFQSNTNGSDFYLAVFRPDAQGLAYGTFFGGSTTAEHVDGGTSRFDKSGTVYQAVCAGCGGNSNFPTTSGVWSRTNNSNNCNLGAFKFDLGAIVSVVSLPQPYVCLPNAVQFTNNSLGGNTHFWDFGDGDTSHLLNPSHTYADTGHYTVTLTVSDSLACLVDNIDTVEIDVFMSEPLLSLPPDSVCEGDSIQLNISGGASYQWIPNTYLSDPFAPDPKASPPVTTTYMGLAEDSCGFDTTIITIHVYEDTISTVPDPTICIGDVFNLQAFGGINYNWYPTTGMINPGSQNPDASPPNSMMYYVDATTADGCIFTDSVFITVVNNLPQPILSADTTICIGDSANLNASGAPTILWTPPIFIDNPNAFSVAANPLVTTMLYATLTNACGSATDSVLVTVIRIDPNIVDDVVICPGDSGILWVEEGYTYNWIPSVSLSDPDSSTTLAFPNEETVYTVTVSDTIGCTADFEILVSLYDLPYVNAGNDILINYGFSTALNGFTYEDNYYWETLDSTISCITCFNPIVKPEETTQYILHVEDTNGCKNTDAVSVILDGVLYVPNSITPNGDGVNDFFELQGREIKTFQLYIYDRWGQLIFETDQLDDYWDGKHRKKKVQTDVYVWKVKYTDYQNNYYDLMGHVSVL